MQDDKQGISNRETAAEEREEQQEFPRVKPSAAQGEQEGSQSAARKESELKGADGRKDA